jgi:carboxylesterase type B
MPSRPADSYSSQVENQNRRSYVPGSALAMSDLEYANRRLRDEQARSNDNAEHSTTASFPFRDTATPTQSKDIDRSRQRPSFINSIFPAMKLRRRTEVLIVSLLAIMLAILVFCIAVFAVSAQAATSLGSAVSLSYGRYQGVDLGNGVTQYLGVRYAVAPKRFSAAQPPTSFNGLHVADSFGSGCQGTGPADPTLSEDCLFADIYAPSNATADSKLPVFVFMQGGGLDDATAHFNGTGLILASGANMITISFSYRVGPFGFLASQEVQNGGDLNVGYLDQRQLLQWVQKEIQNFGGDPGHVVLGGQSAGAGSVVNQLTAYGGQDQHLFQAAIMESQSMPPIRNISDQQFQYDDLVNKTGCGSSRDTLDCLRNLPYDQILANCDSPPYPDGDGGSPVFAYNPVIDGSYIRDIPVTMLQNGMFVHVPTVFGDDTDEGTIFTPHSISTEANSRSFIKNNFPSVTSTQLDKYSSLYNFTDTQDNNYWLKASTAYGETRYICPGMHMSNLITAKNNSNVWNWRYNVQTSNQQQNGQGVAHGNELAAVFGPKSVNPSRLSQLLSVGNGTQVVQDIQGYWTSFIQTYDPNAKRAADSPEWQRWNGSYRLLFDLNGTRMEKVDSSQMTRCGYLAQITTNLGQ